MRDDGVSAKKPISKCPLDRLSPPSHIQHYYLCILWHIRAHRYVSSPIPVSYNYTHSEINQIIVELLISVYYCIVGVLLCTSSTVQ